MIDTKVGGAAALVAIGNVAAIAPAGTVTVAGTDATAGSLLNSRTVVAAASGNASETVPCEGAPFRTVSGEIDSDPMKPVAGAPAGSRSGTAAAHSAARTVRRRMVRRHTCAHGARFATGTLAAS